MIKTKVAFMEGRLFSANQSFNCSNWLYKSWPSKKATFVLLN